MCSKCESMCSNQTTTSPFFYKFNLTVGRSSRPYRERGVPGSGLMSREVLLTARVCGESSFVPTDDELLSLDGERGSRCTRYDDGASCSAFTVPRSHVLLALLRMKTASPGSRGGSARRCLIRAL